VSELREEAGRIQAELAVADLTVPAADEQSVRLMDQGFNNSEACRIVGINRWTGKRWRHGRQATGVTRGAPPVRRPLSPDGPSRYLREPERIHIADRLREKASIRQIAAELGRNPSTISREISAGPACPRTW
jgi:transposase-like protein